MKKAIAKSLRDEVFQICEWKAYPFPKKAYKRVKKAYNETPKALQSEFSVKDFLLEKKSA